MVVVSICCATQHKLICVYWRLYEYSDTLLAIPMNAIPQQATLNAKQLETMANRYAADIHFGHANVIKFRGRPIRNAGCMDKFQ